MHSGEESGPYFFLRALKETVFRPIAGVLATNGVKPDTISYLGVAAMLPFVYFLGFNPWLAFFFIALSLFFDMLDGSLARYLKISSERGAFTDMVCDYISFFIVFLSLVFYGMADPFAALVYVISYLALQSFVSFSVMKGVKLFPVIRTKFGVYFFFLIYLAGGGNYMNEFLIFASFYMIMTDFFIYRKIVCSL